MKTLFCLIFLNVIFDITTMLDPQQSSKNIPLKTINEFCNQIRHHFKEKQFAQLTIQNMIQNENNENTDKDDKEKSNDDKKSNKEKFYCINQTLLNNPYAPEITQQFQTFCDQNKILLKIAPLSLHKIIHQYQENLPKKIGFINRYFEQIFHSFFEIQKKTTTELIIDLSQLNQLIKENLLSNITLTKSLILDFLIITTTEIRLELAKILSTQGVKNVTYICTLDEIITPEILAKMNFKTIAFNKNENQQINIDEFIKIFGNFLAGDNEQEKQFNAYYLIRELEQYNNDKLFFCIPVTYFQKKTLDQGKNLLIDFFKNYTLQPHLIDMSPLFELYEQKKNNVLKNLIIDIQNTFNSIPSKLHSNSISIVVDHLPLAPIQQIVYEKILHKKYLVIFIPRIAPAENIIPHRANNSSKRVSGVIVTIVAIILIIFYKQILFYQKYSVLNH